MLQEPQRAVQCELWQEEHGNGPPWSFVLDIARHFLALAIQQSMVTPLWPHLALGTPVVEPIRLGSSCVGKVARCRRWDDVS